MKLADLYLLRVAILLIWSGCVSPQSVAIKEESSNPRKCVDYAIPGWTFPEIEEHLFDHPSRAGLSFAIRRLDARYLFRGVHNRPSASAQYSDETFWLDPAGGIQPATSSDWNSGEPVPLPPPEVSSTPGDHSPGAFFEQLFPAPGNSRHLRLRWIPEYGITAPKATVVLELVDNQSGHIMWKASGTAPHLPSDQLSKIWWLDERTLFWPRNQLGTRFLACWSLPQ